MQLKSRANEKTIRASELFRRLDQSQIEALTAISVRRTYTSEESIFHQGDDCLGLFIVESGLVRVFRSGGNGQHHVLQMCRPGQTFAEVAVFADFHMPANAVAAQPTECVMIHADALQRELATSHALCRQMLASMAHRTRHFVQLLDDIVLRDATERIALVLCDSPCNAEGWLTLPAAKKDVANHLNLTSETFSRVVRRLSEQGLLKTDANHSIRIQDATRLAELSGHANKG